MGDGVGESPIAITVDALTGELIGIITASLETLIDKPEEDGLEEDDEDEEEAEEEEDALGIGVPNGIGNGTGATRAPEPEEK